jgi:hypothetical protein
LKSNEDDQDPLAVAVNIRWLVLGAIAGLFAAGYGILRQDSSALALPDNALARVNEAIIDRDTYANALARYAALDDRPLTAADKANLAQSLVDDELLLQRGLELGMAQTDTAVRTAIVSSLVASLTAEADAANPSDEELAKHLADHVDRFSYTAAIAIEGWQTDDESLAQDFVLKLRNTGEVPDLAGISSIPDLPGSLVPLETLRDHVGPGIAAATANMPAGSSAIFARRGRWLVLRVAQKETAAITDLDSIRNQVLLDYRRSLADDNLRQYIDDLRDRADIDVALP